MGSATPSFRSSPTPPRVAHTFDSARATRREDGGWPNPCGPPSQPSTTTAHLHHPRPGRHRGHHLDRRLLQPPAASTPASAADPPSNTNDTKRPGQQPHKQTDNNLLTGPDPNYTPNYEEPQKMSQPWEFPPVFTLIRALELGYVNDHRRLSDNELHAARGADTRPHTGAFPAAP